MIDCLPQRDQYGGCWECNTLEYRRENLGLFLKVLFNVRH